MSHHHIKRSGVGLIALKWLGEEIRSPRSQQVVQQGARRKARCTGSTAANQERTAA